MAKSDEILKRTKDLLTAKSAEKDFERTRVERERQQLVTSLGQEIARIIAPAINNLAQSQQVTFSKMREMLREIKVEAPKMPQINIPEIKIPQPRVEVNVPDVRVPPITVPETKIEFPDSMQVTLDQYDNKRPLPVMMMDTKGKPMSFSMGAGGGGKADFLTIKDIRNSTGGSIISNDGALKVEGNFGASLSLDVGSGEIGSQTLRTVQATDAIASVYVTGALGTIGTVIIDPDGNPTYASATSGLTDTELRASSIPVAQVSGAVWSTNVANTVTVDATGSGDVPITLAGEAVVVSSITASTATAIVDSSGVAYSGTNPVPTNMATALASQIDSITTVQLSGAIDSVYVTGASGSLATNIIDSSGVAYSGSNPVPVTGTVVVSSVTASTASALIDSSGVAYSGSNPLPVDATALDKSTDSVLSRPVQVRGSLTTAYATLSTGTETTLASAVAGKYLDLVYIMGANDSDAAVTVFLRPVTAGNIVMALQIPASGTAGIATPVPFPVSDTGNNWTADMGDITGTNVYLSALFSQE